VLTGAGFVRRIRGSGFVAVVAGTSFLIALGDQGLLFPLIYRLGLQSVRYPEKFFLSAIFILSVFAMMAAEKALHDRAVRRAAFQVALLIAAITVVALLAASIGDADARFAHFWALTAPDPDFTQRFRNGMLVTLAFSGLAAVLFRAETLSPRLRIILLAATAVIDLGSRVTSTMPRTTADYYTPPPAARALATSPAPVRIYSHADWQRRTEPQPPLPFGLRHWILRNALLPSSEINWGFEGVLDLDVGLTNLLPMIRFDRLFHAALTHGRTDRLPLLLQMSGASHVSTLKPFDAAVVADPTRFDQIEPAIFVPTHNGRFYFADRVIRGFDENDVGVALFSGARFSPRTAFSDCEFSPASGRVISSNQTTDVIDAEVEAANRGFLVLAVTRHKYWSATIDGSPATIHPTNVAFQGVIVEKGRHHIQLRYRNPLIAVFGCISIVALLATLTIVLAGPRVRPLPGV
jgi:hypothetical protein